MRTFIPVIIKNNVGIRYDAMLAEKAIKFGERQKRMNLKFFFETTANKITEQITFEQLKQMQS